MRAVTQSGMSKSDLISMMIEKQAMVSGKVQAVKTL